MWQQGLVDRSVGTQCLDGTIQVDGIPKCDRGEHQVESAGAQALVFERAVAELTAPALVPAAPSVTGLPLDLLRRRSGVQQTEWELAGATARIGIATANLFPRLGVVGAIGY